MEPNTWENTQVLTSRQYRCHYCGSLVASHLGFQGWSHGPTYGNNGQLQAEYIYICSHCDRPTYFNYYNTQIPAPATDEDVEFLPDNIQILFREARLAKSVHANTAAVMVCRTIIMHVAVERGAPEKNKQGQSNTFVFFINYLEEQSIIPKGAKGWVDKIRTLGNEAIHDLSIMTEHDTSLILGFTTLLLKITYETHGKLSQLNS